MLNSPNSSYLLFSFILYQPVSDVFDGFLNVITFDIREESERAQF